VANAGKVLVKPGHDPFKELIEKKMKKECVVRRKNWKTQ
jgi:hypothetical protein